MDEKRIPAHGRGRLLIGGKIGNKGGGRPPCAIKAACRASFDEGVRFTAKIATGQKATSASDPPTNAEIIRAFNILGKYGFAESDTFFPKDLIPIVSQLLSEYLPPETRSLAVVRFIDLLGECPEEPKV
jgi:hypothetical protein